MQDVWIGKEGRLVNKNGTFEVWVSLYLLISLLQGDSNSIIT